MQGLMCDRIVTSSATIILYSSYYLLCCSSTILFALLIATSSGSELTNDNATDPRPLSHLAGIICGGISNCKQAIGQLNAATRVPEQKAGVCRINLNYSSQAS